MENESKSLKKQNAGDHLANERTYLAWIRTSIGIMGFGFVVVKFSLFVKQISILLGDKQHIEQPGGNSQFLGIALVLFGALITLFSYLRYRNVKVRLEQGAYYNSTFLIKLLTGLIFIISILLISYLLKSVYP